MFLPTNMLLLAPAELSHEVLKLVECVQRTFSSGQTGFGLGKTKRKGPSYGFSGGNLHNSRTVGMGRTLC